MCLYVVIPPVRLAVCAEWVWGEVREVPASNLHAVCDPLVPGWDRQLIIDALVLLREAPWSTKAVEEQHGSMAVMHRQHRELGPDVLQVRSFIHSARFLCCAPENVLQRRTDRMIQQLQRQRPGRVRPVHMFVRDAVAAARRQLGPAVKLSFEGSQRVLVHASNTFNDLPPRAIDDYAARAAARAESRMKDISSEIEFLRRQKAMIEAARDREHQGSGIMHRLSQLKFNDADWARLVDVWNQEVVHCTNVLQMVAATYSALALPPPEEMQKVEKASEVRPRPVAKSNFIRLVAAHRHYFKGMVFMREEPGQTVAHRLLFALQNPLIAVFLPIFPTEREFPLLPANIGVFQAQQQLRHISLFEFTWVPGTFITDRGLGDMDDFSKVWVFEDVVFKGERNLGGSCHPTLLEVFAQRRTELIFKNIYR